MKVYIALFRGINVGGNNMLPMKELVTLLEDLGACNVKTYIQSGNAVFGSKVASPAQLTKKIRAAIKQRRGFEPHVLLLTLEEFEQAIAQNPFPEAETVPQSLHLGFLADTPEHPDAKTLERLQQGKERFKLIGRVFYLHVPEGFGRSKLAAGAEKALGVPMTDRNWRTVCTICEMAKACRSDAHFGTAAGKSQRQRQDPLK